MVRIIGWKETPAFLPTSWVMLCVPAGERGSKEKVDVMIDAADEAEQIGAGAAQTIGRGCFSERQPLFQMLARDEAHRRYTNCAGGAAPEAAPDKFPAERHFFKSRDVRSARSAESTSKPKLLVRLRPRSSAWWSGPGRRQ